MNLSQRCGVTIEVCVDSLESAQLAVAAGCHRLELCGNLGTGGVTPPTNLVRSVLQTVSRPCITLVRPRPGNFYFDWSEQTTSIRSAELLLELGVSGVAVGAIMGNAWDLPFMKRIAAVALGFELVAHRAIDELLGERPATRERLAEIIQPLIDLGFQRILTSGGYPDAHQGADNIRRMVDFAAGRIEILPGGGVSAQNAKSIVNQTGVIQLHGSFRRLSQVSDRIEVDTCQLTKVVAELSSYSWPSSTGSNGR